MTGFAGILISLTAFAAPPLPSGKIAFVTGDFGDGSSRKIWIVRPDGSDLRSLTDDVDAPGEDSPAWSHDGKRIAFSALRNGTRHLYVRESDGRNEICLTPESVNGEGYEQPAWSPDGKWVAFCVWPADRNSSQIYVMRSDGTQKQQITRSDGYNWSPCYSPDGQRIFFETTRDENREVYVMNSDGSQPKNITNHKETDHHPACSPDGRRVAFMSRRTRESAEIFLMDLDGAGLVNLTKHPSRDSEPSWSPDSKWLAFTRVEEGADSSPMDIYLMRADGSGVVPLMASPEGLERWAPSWGPD